MLRIKAKNALRSAIMLFLLVCGCVLLIMQPSQAAVLTSRSVRLTTSSPGVTTVHTFSFNIPSSNSLGSILMEYCINDPIVGAPCVAPTGLNVLGSSVTAQSGAVGFSIHPNSTANRLILTRPPAPIAPGASSYEISNVVNPAMLATSVFVRISTYGSTDASGTRIDEGAVVFSTSGGLGTNGFVPPFLTFCVGVAVAPDCTNTSGNSINLGELSFTEPRSATSQFAGATNDVNGYSVNLFGTTMTSGNNTISALPAPAGSSAGTSQFGINLRSNSNPAVGQNPIGAGTLAPSADFNTPDQFAFYSGILASSTLSTDFNTMTVSYLVNVPNGQAPGVYSTTATFVALVTF